MALSLNVHPKSSSQGISTGHYLLTVVHCFACLGTFSMDFMRLGFAPRP